LQSVQLNGRPANAFNFDFEVTPSADGLAPTPYSGAGTVFCGNPSQTLILWAMGRETFIRARLPLYGLAAALLLTLLAAAAVILVRRARRRKAQVTFRTPRREWIDG
jgi:hypothetical protein